MTVLHMGKANICGQSAIKISFVYLYNNFFMTNANEMVIWRKKMKMKTKMRVQASVGNASKEIKYRQIWVIIYEIKDFRFSTIYTRKKFANSLRSNFAVTQFQRFESDRLL